MPKTQSELLVAEAVKKNIPVLHPDIFHSAPGDEIDLNLWDQLPVSKVAVALGGAAVKVNNFRRSLTIEGVKGFLKPLTPEEKMRAGIIERP